MEDRDDHRLKGGGRDAPPGPRERDPGGRLGRPTNLEMLGRQGGLAGPNRCDVLPTKNGNFSGRGQRAEQLERGATGPIARLFLSVGDRVSSCCLCSLTWPICSLFQWVFAFL